MSATTPEPTTPAPEAQQTETPDTGAQAVDWQAEAEKWKALSRKHEDQSKANADKARQFDEFTEAQKTEQQKLADRLAAAEKVAAEATLKALRAEVAQTKGVPAALLSGDTQEALEASADALLAFRGEAPKLPAAPSAAGQGNVGQPVGATDIDTQIKAANEAGDWRRALSLTNTKLAEQAGKD